MALAKWKCVECKKEFQAGDWECFPGQKHTVESKTYYLDDAPVDRRDCKYSRTVVHVTKERKIMNTSTGEQETIKSDHVVFARGTHSTSNPEHQMFLDNYKACVPEARWREVYFSDVEKMAMREQKLRSDQERLQRQENEFLEREKASVEKRAKKQPGV